MIGSYRIEGGRNRGQEKERRRKNKVKVKVKVKVKERSLAKIYRLVKLK
jgi:hypothetical protein